MIVKTLKIARRLIIVVFGYTLLIIGILLAIPGVPGPGILVVWGGLAILAAEFLWARRLLKKFQVQGARMRDFILRRDKPRNSQVKILQDS